MRVGRDNADLVRGLLWAAQVSGEPWLVPLVLALEPTLHEPKPLNACYAVLGRRADAAAIAALVRMQRRTRHRGKLKQITAALDEAAAGAGVSRSELTELTIPDCGLDRQRQRRLGRRRHRRHRRRRPGGQVRVAWEHGGTTTTKPPASAGCHELVAEVRRAATDLKKALADERHRLEDLLVEDRDWPLRTWRERYLDHPVTGSLADRLLWTVMRRRGGTPACRTRTAASPSPAARRPNRGAGARIRLWHPVDADPEEVRAWRARILAERGRAAVQAGVPGGVPADPGGGADPRVFQPVRGAHPALPAGLRADEGTRLGQQLPGRLGRRLRRRGEAGVPGGRADRGVPPRAGRRTAAATRAVLRDRPGPFRAGPRPGAAGRRRWREVPALVFSEAMRDVDLFVGVTTIATDPTWADGGDRRTALRLLAVGRVRRPVRERPGPPGRPASGCCPAEDRATAPGSTTASSSWTAACTRTASTSAAATS